MNCFRGSLRVVALLTTSCLSMACGQFVTRSNWEPVDGVVVDADTGRAVGGVGLIVTAMVGFPGARREVSTKPAQVKTNATGEFAFETNFGGLSGSHLVKIDSAASESWYMCGDEVITVCTDESVVFRAASAQTDENDETGPTECEWGAEWGVLASEDGPALTIRLCPRSSR